MKASNFIFLLLVCTLLLKTLAVKAQQKNQYFVLPKLTIAKKIDSDFKLNFGIESRQILYEKDLNNNTRSGYEYIVTDASAILSKKTGLNNSFAAGYLLRVSNEQPSHRFIQQFAIVRRFNSFRLSHRFRTDQTVNSKEKPVFRARYRLTPEIPLDGLSVDKKEVYLKINNEYVTSLVSKTYDFEVRIVPLIGYVFKNTSKLEIGLDYRINAFLTNETRQRFFGSINYYLNI